MNYTVAVPKPIKDKIAEWDLPDGVREKIYEAFDVELSTLPPATVGRSVVAPVRCRVHKLAIRDTMTGDLCNFVFWINDTKEAGTRIVIDAEYSD